MCFYWGQFVCVRVSYCYCLVHFSLLLFGCQYQCNRLPGKTRLRNDLLCVKWKVKPHTLSHYSNLVNNIVPLYLTVQIISVSAGMH